MRGSPRARKSLRNWPRKGLLRHQNAGTDVDGPMGTAQGRHVGSRPVRGTPDATALEIGRFAALIAAHFKHRRERVPNRGTSSRLPK